MVLTRAVRDRAVARGDVSVVGLVDVGAGAAPARFAAPRAVAAEAARWAFEPRGAALGVRRLRPSRLEGATLRCGSVNDPAVVSAVAALRPDAALTFLVGEVYGPALLAACGRSVNYHEALLPAYRGIAATAWSVYHGERRSGLTFHDMTDSLDDGPALLQDVVPVRPRATGEQVRRAKTRLAVRRLDDLLDTLVAGIPGRPQIGTPSMFTRAEGAAVVRVPDPSALTFAELERRLRAFELLRMDLAGASWRVTSVRRARGVGGELAFTTADGVRAEPSRFVHLPRPLHRLHGVAALRRTHGRRAARTPAPSGSGHRPGLG